METDFKNGKELLQLCQEQNCTISEAMKRREWAQGELEPEEGMRRMRKVLKIMKESCRTPLQVPRKSVGGLIGGEARKLNRLREEGKSLCGGMLNRAAAYAMATLEVNASMGLIVAAPTAGASGVVPGVLLAMQDVYGLSDAQLTEGLFNAGAIGYLAMRNATVAGAVGGCQAEVGVASAMAASAAVQLMGGSPGQCLEAASAALMHMLGLVCDPIGGLVECPCQGRNAAGAANALTAAELALAGIRQPIPFDEMLGVMYATGRKLPPELRETAMGGCAAAPSGCRYAKSMGLPCP